MIIDQLQETIPAIQPDPTFTNQANINTTEKHENANQNRLQFWENEANQLDWIKKWDSVMEWNRPYSKWFINGKLNAASNCLDTQINAGRGNKKAIVWEGEKGKKTTYTYSQLNEKVNQLSNVFRNQFKIQKGDRVTLYLPLIPELIISVLACAKVGAIHSVVFGGFSANSLRDRIQDSSSKLLITSDGGYRRGQIVPLASIAEEATQDTPSIENILYLRHIDPDATLPNSFSPALFDYATLCQNETTEAVAEEMDSEDPLFILYTSGTTGKPKGIIHTTGGYLTHAKYSTKYVFDLKESDIYWCTADVGWITGHTYLVYGPLSNGATCFVYEGAPDYPDKNRFWQMIETYKINILYTAPTAIRAFMKWGNQYPEQHDLSSLRLLGTVGEPINPEAWQWYHRTIGQSKCPIVDTWWQTETGGIMITTLPGLDAMKPGTAGKTLPGISAKILDEHGNEVPNGGGYLSLTEPWPSMLRGIWGDADRYQEVYWSTFDTYFAGDGAIKDNDDYLKVIGRIDDCLNVAGHRIGTMEVESALVEHPAIAEAAVVGMPDEIKGQAILAFAIPKDGIEITPEEELDIIRFVGNEIGPIAKPKRLIITPDLPKTRSGKIMRRILKCLAEGKEIGDTTTLASPEIVTILEEKMAR